MPGRGRSRYRVPSSYSIASAIDSRAAYDRELPLPRITAVKTQSEAAEGEADARPVLKSWIRCGL